MNRNEKKIGEGLRRFLYQPPEVLTGIVETVNEDDATIEVKLDDNEDLVVPVMLRSTVEDLKGIIVIPEKGSEVVFCSIEGEDEFTLVNASKVAKVLIDVPEVQIKIDELIINNGNNGALVILSKLQANLDSIKSYLDAQNKAISTGLKAVGVGTAASGTTGATAFDTAMQSQQLKFETMNNDKVKH